jgi:hypothetical protein
VARLGENRNVYRLLVGKPEGKRPLGRPRRRWVDNTEMDFVETGYCGVYWICIIRNIKWRGMRCRQSPYGMNWEEEERICYW